MKLIGLASICIVMALVGCGSKTDIVGKWKADTGISATDKSNPAAGLMKGFSSMLSFEFKKDNTFVGPMTMEGTYKVDGQHIELTTTKMMGMDVSKMSNPSGPKSVKGDISDDGKTITIHSTNPGSSTTQDMKLVRDTGQ